MEKDESPGTPDPPISIKEFSRLDLRVGRILSAELIEGTDRLLRLMVDLGAETRQIVAGIATRYTPGELLNRQVIVVANLKTARLRGVESQGMILAAGEESVQGLATFLEELKPGTRIK